MHQRLLTLLLVLPVLFSGTLFAQWSGTVVYSVHGKTNKETQKRDYLPEQVVLETNGNAFRILETGTDFERIWLLDDHEGHVLFHFLGHAVELLEPCPQSRPLILSSRAGTREIAGIRGDLTRRATGWAVESEILGLAPCGWPTAWIPLQCTIQDGQASYELIAETVTEMPKKKWPRKHFQIPEGYEPVDRLTLSTMISSIPID
jgi:hypothetical protein